MSFLKKEKYEPDQNFYQKVMNYLSLDIQIEKLIIKSGQRSVFLCKKDNHQVVLKISEHYPTSISRIKREIKILNEINSEFFPKVVLEYFVTEEELGYFAEEIEDFDLTLHQAIISDEVTPFFITVEEYIEHKEWDNSLIEEVSEPKNAVSVLEAIFQALDILWGKSIVHRDLKPGNILIKNNLQPVIIDLGIAKSFNEGTQQLTPMFFQSPHTAPFASPEQLNGNKENVTYKSDQFSIGVIFYYIFTRKFPYGDFEREDQLVILKRMHDGEIDSISDLNPSVPKELDSFIIRLLKYQPYERFRTAHDILKELISIKENL